MTTDIQQRIHEQVTSNPVVLYIKGSAKFPQCGYSANVVRILNLLGVKDFLAVNVFDDPAYVPGLVEYANWPTLPQCYINGEFIGGSDILTEMYQSGELQQLLSGHAG
ncbi:MAG: Grx4 family monothiol glutaredoxin [Gallionella sp.]|nr:Grx4 family monothiol glutaredoxin [Gallionella sp.]MDD4945551.1 Grx4 family monothiol glutaredoxin [Gallionella sp.]